ncbi:MAG: stage II sporulation protein P [Caldicoprobacterales bacterium]
MERIRINSQSSLAYNIIIITLVAAIIFLSYRLLSNSRLFLSLDNSSVSSENSLEEEGRYKREDKKDFFSEIWTRIKGLDFTDPTVIISSHMPYLNLTHQHTLDELDQQDNSVIASANQNQETSRQSQRPSGDEFYRQEFEVEEETEVSEDIQIQIKNIDDNLPSVNLSGEGAQILIYHTHSREAYRQDPNNPYNAIAAFRSNDLSQTVVGVGEELARQLQARNIPVLHDKTDHEVYPWKSGLYPRSLETIQKRIKEHKSLKIFLDIHRNYNEKLKDPDKEVVIIDGERVAKFFILIGTGEGISGGFSQKPNWRENYQFALKITNKANEKYPGLADDIMVRTGRYNQHISNRAILIEIGNHLTTYAEAKRTAKYLAEILSEVIENK